MTLDQPDPDGAAPAPFVLTRGGRQALDILKTGGAGRVAALFERCFYVAFRQGWICLGTEALPMGPLNVRSSAPGDAIRQMGRLQIDDPVLSSANRLRIGPMLDYVTGKAAIWEPPALPSWTAHALKFGLDSLDRLVGPGSDAGLAGYVPADPAGMPHNRVMAAARPPIGALSRAVRRAFRQEPQDESERDGAVIALLGLGPGLTPSGDDFLGGMLIALDALAAAPLLAALRNIIARHAPGRTNPISLAHLRAAGEGAGHEALHEILASLLAGAADVLPARLAAVNTVGHSSGWDAMAGMSVTLRAYLAAQRASIENAHSTQIAHAAFMDLPLHCT